MAPERDWVFLPPGYRPLALALSTAVVALVVWDKTHSPPEFVAPHVGWKGDRVALKTAAEAPVSQMDLSGRLFASFRPLTPRRALRFASPGGDAAPGKPVEVAEARGAGSGFKARNEEERSAINERLYKGHEREKKKMGIAKILEKESGDRDDGAPLAREATARDVTPEDGAIAKVIVLKNAETLQTAWAAAGLAGEPPAVDFPKRMALFLACPPGCGIVSVRTGKKILTVLYKDSGFADASARVRAVPASPKLTVLMLAP